jgi:hypothetical protein
MNITIDTYRRNPQTRLTLEIAARRARALALGRLFANVFARTKADHAAGSHFARQG